MTPTNHRVLFVGQRHDGFVAAHDLGLEVACVASRAPGRRTPALSRFLHRPLADPAIDLDEIATWAAEEGHITAVFALTERAVLPAARIRRRLRLSGDSPEAAERATDKLMMKRAVSAAGMSCARIVDSADGLEPSELIDRLGLPMVLKDRVGSGNRSTRIVRRREELTEPLAQGRVAESFVDGIEMSVESFIVDGQPVFVNATEYFRVLLACIAPARLPPKTLSDVLDLNARAVRALGIERGITHMEVFLTGDGPVFGEMAARPPGGRLMEIIRLAYGFDPWREWLRLGLGGRETELPAARRTAGVWMLHPGAGVVASVAGVEQARAVPGVERLRVSVEAGATVEERIGSSQEVGHILVVGQDRDQVARRLTRAHGLVRIELRSGQT